MELATFETLDEFLSFRKFPALSKLGPKQFLSVDGMTKITKSKTEWFYTKNGMKVPFSMPWLRDEPSGGIETCLSIGKKKGNNTLGFNDVPCGNLDGTSLRNGFVCQKMDFVVERLGF